MADIYFDHAATTPVLEEVKLAMNTCCSDNFANPASSHLPGQKAAAALEDSRELVANFIGAKKGEEIVFTSGGTESDNLAIKGTAMALKEKGNHIITTSIEHHAVLESCRYLEKHFNFEVTYLEVDQAGFVKVDDLKAAIREDTILISIMYANNEIGTIQPIKELAAVAKENDIIFHTDAVQVAGQLEINVSELNVDLLSISAHKFNGPKGVGALFVRKGIKLIPQLSGGSQERKRRAGTVNLPAVVGMAKASEIAKLNLTKKKEKLTDLRNYFIKRLETEFNNLKINGAKNEMRLPGNIHLSFENLDGESLLFNLSLNDIAASTGSACASGSLSVSHVLKAIGLEKKYAKSSLRFTLGAMNTKEEIDFVMGKLKEIVSRLKSLK